MNRRWLIRSLFSKGQMKFAEQFGSQRMPQRMPQRLHLASFFWLCLIPVVALGQARPNQVASPPPASPATSGSTPISNVLIDPSEDYHLAAGDTIDLFVEDASELSQVYRLTAAGNIEMPFLGAVKAQGKTTNELARFIANSLREQDYLKQPQVRVAIKQYSGQIFFIQGAVRSPGLYQLEGKPSLLKLISLAGGLLDNNGPTALILRPTKKNAEMNAALSATAVQSATAANEGGAENDDYELIKVALTPLFQQGRTEQNVKLEPGDIVNIPPAKVFYVAGEVHAPGSFQLKEGTTLRQAISLAQGTTFKAALAKGVIFRDDPETGKRQEIRIDVGAVMNGKHEDMVVFPNDVIIVPNSRMKSVSSALLSAFGVNSARVPMRY